ncbi:MAG: alpha/beta hydrolase [Bacteroidetes bacterium]|jgi:alpha-beta hydrolase superfamily lysophospholipase|nr:alpha/beta hydrolase [Bacteroidota bacterium]MBT3749349.1 alpha/beta hydrolase [Bacteroidota bacterium]MBT4401807.1 alpha/beta hydrolase [Bacteroidota bacterium]MBT5426429.1 alpha/beta hydrolase [Bacteroidota bacterium]MBT7092044.1 alpha/beta hydrolase [Bacteroidota bacterium]
MQSKEFKLVSSDGINIHVYEWLPDDPHMVKAIIQIAHGMAEHAGRYENFARFLTDNDFAVYANDHRGHGKTAGELENVGFLAPKDGWARVVNDFAQVGKYSKEQHKDKALYIMGHSMGSFIVRNYLTAADTEIQGAIFSGTADDPGMLGKVGILLTRLMMLFYPAKSPSPFMDKLSFGAFNKAFKPNRTKFDWLSRDDDQVDKYIADPYCGGIFSIGFFKDMLGGILFVSQQKNINKIPLTLPVLIFSGENDPVGDDGKGVKAVYEKFKKAGHTDLNIKLFAEGRHEMLNEINKEEVYHLVLDWLNTRHINN